MRKMRESRDKTGFSTGKNHQHVEKHIKHRDPCPELCTELYLTAHIVVTVNLCRNKQDDPPPPQSKHLNSQWRCLSSPVSTSKHDLPLFPLFIFSKPSRLRQIPVGVLFWGALDHYRNGWQSMFCLLVPTHTCQEVKDTTERSHHSSLLTLRPNIVRCLKCQMSG